MIGPVSATAASGEPVRGDFASGVMWLTPLWCQ